MTGAGIALASVIALVVAAAVVMLWPLRGRRDHDAEQRDVALEIARDSKLHEISDLQLDFALGKLSVDDYEALNATLRAEAAEILRRIDSSAGEVHGTTARRTTA